MKRVLCLFLFICIFCTSAFSRKFFDDRYFEVKIDVPFSISNNSLSADKLFRDEIVIDFRELAENLSDKGYNQTFTFSPSSSISLNLEKVFIGLIFGTEGYLTTNISKDLIDFLAYGNQINEELNFGMKMDSEMFSYSSFKLGIKMNTIRLTFIPSVFIPVYSLSGDVGKVSVLNDNTGKLEVGALASIDLYSYLNFEDFSFSVAKSYLKSIGFDFAGIVEKQIDERLGVEVDFRVPIVPGRLNQRNHYDYLFTYETSVLNFSDGDSYSETNRSISSCHININRPMYFMGYMNFVPSYMVLLRGGIGLGIRHPFVEGAYGYLQYYLGGSLHFGKILVLSLSSEYTNQIFINQFAFSLNLRVVQMDAGISLQSASFAKSFTMSGFGAYISYSFGY